MSVANRNTFGRKTIYSSYSTVTPQNIREIVSSAMQIHESNRNDIKYLIEYEKGNQPILNREKYVREEINEKVVENHASQIVNFKLSYVFGSPITYVQKAEIESGVSTDESIEKDDNFVTKLNEMCFDEGKHIKDQELAKTFLTCGVGYRACFPSNENGFSPFNIINLDPMSTFIIYSPNVFHKPLLAVTYWTERDETGSITKTHYTAYSDEYVYEFNSIMTSDIKVTKNGIGTIPIVEYRYDYEKMGCFERVIDLLNAINVCTSDRVNGLAQFVQSFLWFNNVDIESEDFQELKKSGALSTSSHEGLPADIKLIESSLNQTEVQTLSDYLYNQLLQICNIPGRESASGSTTGQSSVLNGGWQEAEEDAHRLEQMFVEGEKKFLKVVKNILDKSNTDIQTEVKLRDIDIKFSRNKIANMLVKTQGLCNMKTFGIHPRIAIQTSDLFSDPNQVYLDSKSYIDGAWQTQMNTNQSTDVKDLQENPQGDNPLTVTETQNEQMSFKNQG